VLVAGLVLPALLLAAATQRLPGLVGPAFLGTWLVLLLGAYFLHFWTRTGQTLAMLTWRIRLVTREGTAISWRRALLRYALGWLWVLPALLVLKLSGLNGFGPFTAALLTGLLTYWALARLHPDRQYLHDVLCRTRLIRWNPPKAPPPR
jgi:uncharacterized RDD family membrane protein YckC